MSMTTACGRPKQAHFYGFSLLAYLADNERNKFWYNYVSRYTVSGMCWLRFEKIPYMIKGLGVKPPHQSLKLRLWLWSTWLNDRLLQRRTKHTHARTHAHTPARSGDRIISVVGAYWTVKKQHSASQTQSKWARLRDSTSRQVCAATTETKR